MNKSLRNIGLLYNPISGAGRSKKIATGLADQLSSRGYQPALRESQPSYDPTDLRNFLKGLDALLVVGGDGTIRTLLDGLSESGTPVYLVPGGNESLFARHFGMSRQPSQILAALSGARTAEATIAAIHQSFFFSMVSLGLDSLVVGKIARTRCGPIGHIGYVKPTLQSLLEYSAPALTVAVDGKVLVREEPGFVIAANTRQYARNLGLVPEACGTKELLHVRFFPYRRIADYLPWLWSMTTRRPVSLNKSLYVAGTNCTIETGAAAWPIQADGEYVGDTPAALSTVARRIKVLLPIART